MEVIVQPEGRFAERAEDGVITTAGQSVDDGVEAIGAILDAEIISKQLAYPLMLRDHRQALIEHEFGGVVAPRGKGTNGAPPG